MSEWAKITQGDLENKHMSNDGGAGTRTCAGACSGSGDDNYYHYIMCTHLS